MVHFMLLLVIAIRGLLFSGASLEGNVYNSLRDPRRYWARQRDSDPPQDIMTSLTLLCFLYWQ